jgi:Spy/CpxP family protein refolding chaperone
MTAANQETSRRRIRVVAAMVLAGTFLLGVLTGVGVAILLGPRHGSPLPPSPLHELNLTAEQTERLHALQERYRPQLEQILREAMPKARAIQEKIESEMREVLTPEQRAKLDALTSRAPRIGPPPPPGTPWPPPPGGPQPLAPSGTSHH